MTRKKVPLLLLFFFVAVVGLSGGERFLGFSDDDPLPTPSASPAPAPAPARSLGDDGGGLHSFIHYWFPRQPHSSLVWPVRRLRFFRNSFYLLFSIIEQPSIVIHMYVYTHIFPA